MKMRKRLKGERQDKKRISILIFEKKNGSKRERVWRTKMSLFGEKKFFLTANFFCFFD